MLKLKCLLCTLLSIFSFQQLDATNNDSLFVPHANVIKTRLILSLIGLVGAHNPGIQKMISIHYERVITKKSSFIAATDWSKIKLEFDDGYMALKGVDLYLTYRHYPFNKTEKFPQGFHIGPSVALGLVKGNEVLYYRYYDYGTNAMVLTSIEKSNKNYQLIATGIGGVLGWQYFIGKRKRFNMDISLSGYFGQSFMRWDDSIIMYQNPLRVLVPGLCLGYTFGKIKNKKGASERSASPKERFTN